MLLFYLWFFFDSDATRRKKKYAYLKRVLKNDQKATLLLAVACKRSGDRYSAKYFYSKAAHYTGQNGADAANNLGSIFYEESNIAKALEYYKIGAEKGSIQAQRNYGFICEQDGDLDIAISWYKAAHQNGHQEARVRLKHLLSRPKPRQNMDFRLAEIVAREWMFYFGFRDAKTTKLSGDGGIDVESSQAVAQVKYRKNKSGGPELQQLGGAALKGRKKAIFFSYAGYTKSALAYANEPDVSMALFVCDQHGVPTPANMEARKYFK